MRVRTFPERYLAYVEGAIERALREVEAGEVPDFMDDEHLTGTAAVLIGATDAPEVAVAPLLLTPMLASPTKARRNAVQRITS